MRNRLLVWVLLALFLNSASLIAVLQWRGNSLAEEAYENELVALKNLASSSIEAGLTNGLPTFVKSTLENLKQRPMFLGGAIFDEDLTAIVTFPEGVVFPSRVLDALDDLATSGDIHSDRTIRLEGEGFALSVIADEDDEILAYSILAFTRRELVAANQQAMWFGTTLGILIALASLILIWRRLTTILSPLLSVTSAIERIASGEDAVEIEDGAIGEIGALTKSFRVMKGRLDEYHDKLMKETERADLANRLKSQFLANMSHEIRTPLNGVLGMADVLRETNLDALQQEHLEVISQSGDNLLLVLNDILDISKIEAGELVLEAIVFDIDELIHRNIKLWSPRAEEKGIVLESYSNVPLDLGLVGDEHRLHQIMSNLISNAIKFTDGGRVEVSVKVLRSQKHSAKVEICVSDTGIGISQNARKSLFAPFSQADLSTTRKFGGTGLGLSICKRLVEAMEGSIEILDNEEAGRGTVFKITLELDLDEEFSQSELESSSPV